MLSVSDVAFVAEPLNYFRSHPATQRIAVRGARLLDEKYRVWPLLVREIHPEPANVQTILDRYYAEFCQFGLPLRSTDPRQYRALCRSARCADRHWRRRRLRAMVEGFLWRRWFLWRLSQTVLLASRFRRVVGRMVRPHRHEAR